MCGVGMCGVRKERREERREEGKNKGRGGGGGSFFLTASANCGDHPVLETGDTTNEDIKLKEIEILI